MTFDDYQKISHGTAQHKGGMIYPVLGLAGETGEVVEKFKKLIRDNDGVVDEEFIRTVRKELGDVLWYLSELCSQLGLRLDDVAAENISKLAKRREQGKIQGNGDDREEA